MARYKEKTEADLAWTRIRAEAQFRINCALHILRLEMLNRVLPPLQDRFEQAYTEGTILELEPSMDWVDGALEEIRAHATGR